MEDYQQRVVKEKEDLDGKIQRLIEFIGSDNFNNLIPSECKRLRRQEMIMELYSEVLAERIGLF